MARSNLLAISGALFLLQLLAIRYVYFNHTSSVLSVDESRSRVGRRLPRLDGDAVGGCLGVSHTGF